MDRDKKQDFDFWMDRFAREGEQVKRFRDFLIPGLPELVRKCRREMEMGISQEDQRAYEGLLKILYKAILLFYGVYMDDGFDLLELEELFGPEFDLRADVEIEAHKKGFSVDFFKRPFIESAAIRQDSLTAEFKFQVVRPQLAYLLQRFDAETGIMEVPRSWDLTSCWVVVAYLKHWINQDPRSGHFYDD